MQSFKDYVTEANLANLTTTIKALLSTKKVTSAQEQYVHRILATRDVAAITKLITQLEKFPSVETPESKRRYNKFLTLWKARPVYGPRYKRSEETTEQSMTRYFQEVAAYFRKYFGGRAVWTDAFLNRYFAAAYDESPKITYKGKRYPLATGMDERDFVWDVIEDTHVKL